MTMPITNAAPTIAQLDAMRTPAATAAEELITRPDVDRSELREKFDDFVGELFYGQMLKAMRSTQQRPAYFHGGRAEEIFQGQLDQMLAERMTEAGAEQLTDSMFDLFTLNRR